MTGHQKAEGRWHDPRVREIRREAAQCERLGVAAGVEGCDGAGHERRFELRLVNSDHQVGRSAGRGPGRMKADFLPDHEVSGARI